MQQLADREAFCVAAGADAMKRFAFALAICAVGCATPQSITVFVTDDAVNLPADATDVADASTPVDGAPADAAADATPVDGDTAADAPDANADDTADSADSAGFYVASPAAPCDSANPCATGVCDSGTHTCVTCLKNSDCPAKNLCLAQACVPATVCASDLACKASGKLCDSDSGFCVDCLLTADCDSGQTCLGGQCVVVSCGADKPCALGSFCAASGKCEPALCSGPACGKNASLFACKHDGGGYIPGVSCSDSNTCTLDNCVGSSCVHLPISATCTDGSACTSGDTCVSGLCLGKPLSCDDKNVCTLDTCSPGSGCIHTSIERLLCNDGNACTTGETCQKSVCTGGSSTCDDGNSCTVDSCGPGAVCSSQAVTGTCSDGDACTSGETCTSGVCLGGKPINCSDGNACTDDACGTGKTCVHTFNSATCDDGSSCTIGDICKNGNCSAGKTNCDDSNACTVDSCNGSACSHKAVNCDDGNPCTLDQCSGSACTHVASAVGSVCGAVGALSDFACSGSSILVAYGSASCTSAGVCSSATGDIKWGPWQTYQACGSNSVCVVNTSDNTLYCQGGTTSGSCIGHCGAKGTGSCYCDTLCVSNGDCCTDYSAQGCGNVTQCGSTVGSCSGICGNKNSTAGCYCDATCETTGDCCPDKKLCGCQ